MIFPKDSPPAKQLASFVSVVVKPLKPPVPLKDRLGKKGEGGDDRDVSRSRSRGRSRSRSRSRRRDSRSRWSTFTPNYSTCISYQHSLIPSILVRSRSRRRSRSGSRRRRSRSRFQTHLVLILLPPVVHNLLLRIDADFKAILFSIFLALCSTCFFPRSSSERRRRNRDKSPLQVRMKRLFPCFKSCFNCSQEKQEQRSARRSKR